MDWLRRRWHSPAAEKWGRLGLGLIVMELIYVWLRYEHPMTTNDQKWILTTVVFTCIIALVASVVTTLKYYLRSVGLFILVLGFGSLSAYFGMRTWGWTPHPALYNHAAAALIVGAPCLAIGTITAVAQWLGAGEKPEEEESRDRTVLERSDVAGLILLAFTMGLGVGAHVA